MSSYLFPIKMALISFPFIAFFLTLPFVIYQYRKYKYVNKIRVIVLYSFLLYMITSYYLVILPLPASRDIKVLNVSKYYQLIPFNFIQDFLKETNVVFSKPITYMYMLQERAFLQIVFNILLFIPLGIYIRYYFRKDLKRVILISFIISLFFEITQLTGLYGLYKYPYRLFDVDDLMLNTLGGIIGYYMAPVFMYFLPDSGTLDENVDFSCMKVSFTRRLIAFFIDWIILNIIIEILAVKDSVIFNGIVVFIYFILIVYLTNGKTVGKKILNIKIKGQKDVLTFKEVFLRYSILYYGVIGVNRVVTVATSINENAIILYVMMLFLFVYDGIIFVHFILHLFKKEKQFFYEKVSNTKNVIITE
ncbi:VanZ family protein [Clostridium rectalis]|uniref:VanZ family protein n=1 Tax=Clostridium rectalis TaxID=2040295 RepID=UPI000F62CCAD|nr:VanZ family protein [Clostridium rectalis]